MPHGNTINTGDHEWQLDLTCSEQTLTRYQAQQDVETAELPQEIQPREACRKKAAKPHRKVDLAEGLFSFASHINGLINIILKLCAAGLILYILLYLFAGG